MLDRHGPLLKDIPIGQKKQFASGFGRRENTFGFGDFAQLAVIAFHRIGGVDQAPDGGRIVEHRRQVIPVGFPGTDCYGILLAPAVA